MRLGLLAAAVFAAPTIGWCAASPAAPPALSAADARAILRAVAAAGPQGLPAPDLSAAAAALQSADPAARAAGDAALSAAAVTLAAEEHGMRIDPKSVDSNFALRAAYDATIDFAQARQAGRIAAWLAGLTPADPDYADLVKARQAYAAIVETGGWPTVPAGRPPKLGADDARAPLLRARLAAEGFAAAPAKDPDVFDPALAAALAAFQARHGLKPDGALTSQTLAALNTPAEARLAAIDANLERARWLPRPMPAERIEVDTGDPQATLFEAGAPVLTMRAIVGQPTKRTPTFVSKVTAIEFNPPWIVPADIAARELFPKERRSPGYFARNDFYVANGQVIQRAGPKASLGYLKFEMPDPFDVYLHDTPARSLFTRDKRWLSHGCMRVENPRDLAAALLAPQGWDRAAVDAAIAAGATRTVLLQVQPPVFVVYRTVVADTEGRATFRPDAYGWDAKLATALGER